MASEHVVKELRSELNEDAAHRGELVDAEFWISLPGALTIIEDIARLIRSPRRTRPDCVSVVGSPNVGKSRVILRTHELFREFEVVEQTPSRTVTTIRQFISLQAPGNPNAPNFLANIAGAIENNPRLAREYAAYRPGLIGIMKSRGVRVIAIDNCQRMTNTGAKTQGHTRNIVGELSEAGFSFAFFGSDPMMEWLHGDEHIASRILYRRALKEYSLSKAYGHFLDAVEKNLPLRKPSKLSATLAPEIFAKAGGLPGENINLLRLCAHAAFDREECITRAVLDRVPFLHPSQRTQKGDAIDSILAAAQIAVPKGNNRSHAAA